MDRAERVVTGHRWTKDGWFVRTEEGDINYLDAKDAGGLGLYQPRLFEAPAVAKGSTASGVADAAQDDAPQDESGEDGAEDQGEVSGGRERRGRADPLPADPPADPPLEPADLRAVAAELNAELARSRLAGKVTARAVMRLLGRKGRPIQGCQLGREILVSLTGATDRLATLRHEIVHALRDPAIWGQSHGLFTRAEWLGLVRHARADEGVMAWVRKEYPELKREAQVEEAIAELYAEWARTKDAALASGGPLARAFAKMQAVLDAPVNALRRRGFQSAALTFERMASGRVGGRGPEPGGGGRQGAGEPGQPKRVRGKPGRSEASGQHLRGGPL